MIDWDNELEKIFEDPLFADVTKPAKKETSSDRLVAGFQRITDFVQTQKRFPGKSDDREERSLYNQLLGILKDPHKKECCKPFDELGILESANEIVFIEPDVSYGNNNLTVEEQLEAIFNDPLLNNTGEDVSGLFELPDYMKQKLAERREADYVARREKCEDFHLFENGFKEVHRGLATGKYRLIKFKEAHIEQGRYFLEDGVLVYIAALDKKEKNRHGRNDTRTRCIYENGMESGIFMQTLCKNLYTSGYSIQDVSNIDESYLDKQFSVSDNDVESGVIYVLKSMSTLPEIASVKNLYKIGFTTTPLETRIANAKNEPTYLCADVKVVATWRVYNIKTSVLEALIHKLFDSVRLDITVDGSQPKEWFIVPLNIIEQAIKYIIEGKSISYDRDIQQLIILND